MTKALSNGTGRSFWLSSLTIFLQFFTACLGFQAKSRAFQIQQTEFLTQLSVASVGTHENMSQETSSTVPLRKFLIHWKGEKDVGYSKPFRQLEFTSALEAELELPSDESLSIEFVNALNYTGQAAMADVSIEHFNEAMQYLVFRPEKSNTRITKEGVIAAVERCSIVHAVYEVIASADDVNKLAALAIEDGGFEDMYKEGVNKHATWCFRARNYGELAMSDVGKEKRYSSRARSMKMEKEGLKALTDLLLRFGGKVDLLEPDCKIYIFDGLENTRKVLSRRLAVGPKTSSIAPSTRICVTNTPLCPIAAYALCNVARIRNGNTVLDPYAGSCATLLAAAMIAPSSETVGIEIAHNGLVNRDDIRRDFSSRGLTQPKDLILGDSAKREVRLKARAAIGNKPFDVIIADPPYGIRESTNYNEKSPLEELFLSISNDRESDARLLKKGGRLVAFVPVTDEESLQQMLPDSELTQLAGLSFEVSKEQPLNDKLSRWLVSFKCER